jgi:signal peptidase complex subunit 1
MDYHGQKLAEWIYYILTIIFGGIFWIIGYIMDDFTITVYGWFCGLVISLLLCIPDWPMFRKHPVQWLGQIPDHSQYEKMRKTNKKGKKNN